MGPLTHKKSCIFAIIAVISIVVALTVVRPWHHREYGIGDQDIPCSVLHSANSVIRPVADRAIDIIKHKTLINTGYNKWNSHRDGLRVLIKRTAGIDGDSGDGDELFVSLSLPPRGAVIAYYKRYGGAFKYVGKIPDLLPVTGIHNLKNAHLGNRLLVVNQVQDEMLGAFFNAHYSDIFLWQGGYFVRVLGLLTDYNAYWNEGWDGKDRDAHWVWLKQSSDMIYADNGETINMNRVQKLLQSIETDTCKIPAVTGFTTQYFRTVREEYRWDGCYGLYILGEYTDRSTGETVALLKDYRKDISSFIRGTEFDMVRIMNKNNSIEIIPSDRLQME